MALVSYDYDSTSDPDDDDDAKVELSESCVILKTKETTNNETEPTSSSKQNSISELLSVLPKCKEPSPGTSSATQIDDKIEDFIPKWQPVPKPQKEKVKITIPSLSQFENDDDDESLDLPKRMKLTAKNSGLLALLPPVKGSPLTNLSFVPKVLTKKSPASSSTSNSLVPHSIRKKAELAKKAALKKATAIKPIVAADDDNNKTMESDDDDDIVLPDTFDDDMWQKACGRKKQIEVIQNVEADEDEQSLLLMQQPLDLAPEPVRPYDGLDNAAFKELMGKSKRPQNIKLIDINEEEVISDKDAWITRALTDPEQKPKPEVEDPVDPTRKRKHHITYLAEQAKANEQDFKNQWAASKYNRNQTRAKYGF